MRIFKDKDKKYTNHLKKYKDKIKELQIIINRYKGNSGWTNNLFFLLLGVSLWLWFQLVCSFF